MGGRAILKKCVIAIAGDLGTGRDPRNIQRWVEINGGAFSFSINEGVTHLLCSKEYFKKHKEAILKQTDRYRLLKVVAFDWLEDSLNRKSKKREDTYLLEKKAEALARKREARQRSLLLSNYSEEEAAKPAAVKNFEQGCEKVNERSSNDGYHIYRDDTGFAYDVTLARRDLAEKLGNGNRAYLKLYESAGDPKTYFSSMTCSSPHTGSFTQTIAPKPSSQVVALSLFKDFFKVKTGVEWDNRDIDDNNQETFEWAPWRYFGPAEPPVDKYLEQAPVQKSVENIQNGIENVPENDGKGVEW